MKLSAASRGCTWLVIALLGASCGDGRERLTIYSPHGAEQLALLEAAFEAAHPDIDVRWLDMGSQEVLDRIRFERPNPAADLWFGGPSTLFEQGVTEELIEPYRPVWADAIDQAAIGPDELYWPVYRTPAVLAWNTELVTPEQAPADWDDVLDRTWTRRVLIRDPMASGTMRAIWGLLLQRGLQETGDTAAGMAWLRRLDGQTVSYTLNPAILYEKLARGEGAVTLWDLQDILISQEKGMPFDFAFPSSGTVVIDDAIAIVRGTRHRAAAERYVDFVGSVAAQILTAERFWRLPARTDLPLDQVPAWVADVERRMVVTPMDWGLLAREGPGWMRYWDQRVRGSGGTP